MKRKLFLKNSFNSLAGVSMMANMTPGSVSLNNKILLFNVYDYGARGNGKDLDTKAIQKAIDACHKAGGGIVVFPRGTFLTGTIFLKNQVFLKLDPSATILGSTGLSDYDSQYPHLMYANKIQNAGIIGEGTINGQGEAYWRGKSPPYHRPEAFIFFKASARMTIQGITVKNSPGWCISLVQGDNVHVDDISIINDHAAPNTDGIDPISSTNVFISNCYIDTGDDAICLKAHKKVPTENVVVTNCILISDDAALKLGTSSHGDIKNCVFNNIIIRDSTYGIALFVKDKDSHYENIQFSNINIETLNLSKLPKAQRASFSQRRLQRLYPIFMDIEPRTPDSGLGAIRNISLKDIHINTWNGNCLIQGRKKKYIEDISLEHIHMRVHSRIDYTGRKKPRGTITLANKKSANDFSGMPSHFSFANIHHLTLKNIVVEDITDDQRYKRHEVWGTHLTDVTLNDINYRPAPADKNFSTIHLEDCKNVWVKGSRSPVSKAAFITCVGEATDNINVMCNDFFHAKQMVHLENVSKDVLFESSNRRPKLEGWVNECLYFLSFNLK